MDSKNSLLLEQALITAAESGAVVHHWDHVENPLPLVGAEGCWEDDNVKKFQDLASSCHGFDLRQARGWQGLCCDVDPRWDL
jgi:NAD(P)H-dependent FMN reductase